MKISEILNEAVKQRLDAKCWKGKHKEGTKMKGGVRVNNCVPNESVEVEEGYGRYYCSTDKKWKTRQGPKQTRTSESVELEEKWTQKYKKSINCSHPKGFSQKAHCAGKKKNEAATYEMVCPDCGTSNALAEAAKKTMSRAAKGNEKYGKDGMKALAKAGREGASEKELDVIRDKHDNYNESLKDPKDNPCWKGYKPVGTKKKGGKTVPNCVPTESIEEDAELDRIRHLSGMINEQAEMEFDQIEEWVEALAEAHGVDSEVIWEDFESVDDHELLDEAAAWRTSKGKSKKGGLNAKGVASYRRENPGSKLQMAVTTKPSKLKKGSKAAKRRKSFCARMGGVKGPMKKPNGKPTRKALALRKWNC